MFNVWAQSADNAWHLIAGPLELSDARKYIDNNTPMWCIRCEWLRDHINPNTLNKSDTAWGYWDIASKEKEKELKCECGVDVTMGKDADDQFHSTWCPKYKKKEDKNDGRSKEN